MFLYSTSVNTDLQKLTQIICLFGNKFAFGSTERIRNDRFFFFFCLLIVRLKKQNDEKNSMKTNINFYFY